MKHSTLAALCAALSTIGAVQAAEITGGSVGLSYSAFADDTDVDKLSLSGSVEVGFNRNVSLQFDAGQDSFGASDIDMRAIGLHAIYHMNDATSFGAFYTREEAKLGGLTDKTDILGLEFGHETGQVDFEGFVGRGESDDGDGTIFGVSGRYAMANEVGVTGAFDRISSDGIDLDKLTLQLDSDVGQNVNVFVEVGAARVSGFGQSETEPFVGIGGKITFGAERGATFERRSLGDLLPGL